MQLKWLVGACLAKVYVYVEISTQVDKFCELMDDCEDASSCTTLPSLYSKKKPL